ncbi:cation diffusion facilitator family transporter [Nonomuraea endophytica]|uniref:Cobalt-zinc-cadmium efflux system protein n=1 Tax=Nonomuraea endophytica TaxID=714136 RepID=A0A7W8A1K9_9ACTN|nr:cation diffusion facilitator family transporter [Nonomuraea endophytica]MBB5077091.1 cobalt-zinc-cadmium efflux system protein [Nonomuraea endophytica]
MTGGHGHGSASATARYRGRMAVVIGITSVIFVAQIAGGLLANSLALISDALHSATDVTGVLMALIASMFAARPASQRRTFGYYRLEILAAVANAVLLFGIAVWVFAAAWERFFQPPEVASGTVLVVAGVGLAVNLVSMALLYRGQKESLNVRGAYLEVLGDMLGSVAVLVAALVIQVTGWFVVDPIASVVVAVMILPRAWRLLREAVEVLLQATPKGMDLSQVRAHMLEREGVLGVHDLHAWTLTSGLPVLTAHVVVADERLPDAGRLLDELHECLTGHFDVEHSTIQLEPAGHAAHEGSGHE